MIYAATKQTRRNLAFLDRTAVASDSPCSARGRRDLALARLAMALEALLNAGVYRRGLGTRGQSQRLAIRCVAP
jgi:hypothetical protein